MKANTQQTLLLLYTPPGAKTIRLPLAVVESIWSDLTKSGQRSLLRQMVDRQLLVADSVSGEAHVVITDHGRRACERLFPSLQQKYSQWDGVWSCMVFLKPPKSDPQFRFLRRLLVEERALAVNRGVYLFPAQFPYRILTECEQSYVGSVLITGIKQWTFGDERAFVTNNFGIIDLSHAYSGISSELELLIGEKLRLGRLRDQSKMKVVSILHRLFELLLADSGLLSYYFPQVEPSNNLLLKIQHLLSE